MSTVTLACSLGCGFIGSVNLLPDAFDHNLHCPEGTLGLKLPHALLQGKSAPMGRDWELSTS